MSAGYQLRVTGPIMDHPALENFELVHTISEALNLQAFHSDADIHSDGRTRMAIEMAFTGRSTFANVRNDRFVEHDMNPAIYRRWYRSGGSDDPLEREHNLRLHANEIDPLEREARERLRASQAETARYNAVRRRRRAALQASHLNNGRRRGYDDARAIAEGERICLEHYGPSANALLNTSLEPAELAPAPPLHPCRAQVSECTYATLDWDPRFHDLADLREYQARERQRTAEFHADLDRAHDELQKINRSLPALVNSVQLAANAWSAHDNKAYARWEKHVLNAHKCSTAACRVWQIVCWYRNGVPKYMMDACMKLATAYTEAVVCKVEIWDTEFLLGNEELIPWREPQSDEYQKLDDEGWAARRWLRPDQEEDREEEGEVVWFGSEDKFAWSPNGFGDYVAKGEGASAIVQHLLANFEARKVRLAHVHKERRIVFDEWMEKFVSRAQKVITFRAAGSSGEARKAFAGALCILSDYHRLVIGKKRRNSAPDSDAPDKRARS